MNKADFHFFNLPGKQEYAYLDSAATTLKPNVVVDALTQAYNASAGSAKRGLYQSAEQATTQLEETRKAFTDFLKVKSDSIIFTKNATESLNMVTYGWVAHNVQEGDEIVTTMREHHANFIVWQQLAQVKKIKFTVIPVDAQGELVANATDYITSRTKLLAIGHVSNVTGVEFKDLHTLTARAKSVGAAICIDGAQAVSYKEDPIKTLDPDFYAFSAHKMCGPYGVGFLYVNPKRHNQMKPFIYGGGAVFNVTQDSTHFLSFPHSFEPGTVAIPEIIGSKVALEYLHKEGILKNAYHANSLVKLFLDTIDLNKIAILGDKERIYNESHLVSFVVKGFHAHDVATYLDAQGIAVRAGNHCAQPLHNALGIDATVRVSFYGYNTKQDVYKCVNALNQLCK